MYLGVLLGFALVLGAMSIRLTSEYQYGNEGIDKTVKRRQAGREWCSIPPPLKNGKYRPNKHRCLPNNTPPACLMMEGAFVFSEWPIFLDYCDPGHVATNAVAVCIGGSWTPRLPECEECPPSDTLVNGKTVCKGDIVFEDTFTRHLSSKWKHDIFFGSSAWKFNIFTSDIKNSFTRDGSLVIRPTVYNDSYVTSGSVELEGCPYAPEYCVRTGSSDNVLPPVATANINTKSSFSFTYGEVEIRAKLPKGDWLMPRLFLASKQKYYGTGATSGRVEFGVTLGNSDLRCGSEDLGLGRMENRIYLGPENKERYKELAIPNLSEKWYDQYHIYTLIWKPGSIVFKYDNELVNEIAPNEKTLCETYNDLTEEECMIYNNGTILAPYDKEFYIGLALAAEDLRTATDGCINRGKVKPWKHNEPQVVLKFWQDRENWLPTWTEEGSSLYIDYVRVTAV